MTKHDLDWFKARKGKEIIRMYKDNETKVIINGEAGDNYIDYFFNLQNEGFAFRDTGATIAVQNYDFDLPEPDKKRAARPKISVSDSVCTSCEG